MENPVIREAISIELTVAKILQVVFLLFTFLVHSHLGTFDFKHLADKHEPCKKKAGS